MHLFIVLVFILSLRPESAGAHDLHPIEISAMRANVSGGITIVLNDTPPKKRITCALYDAEGKAFAVERVISSPLATEIYFIERPPEDWKGARCVYE